EHHHRRFLVSYLGSQSSVVASIVSNYSYEEEEDEAEALSDAIEEFSMASKKVVRIKDILLDKDIEPHSVILDSLRKLKLMSLNVDILKSTEIGKAVNGLTKHVNLAEASPALRKPVFTKVSELRPGTNGLSLNQHEDGDAERRRSSSQWFSGSSDADC
ncbi:unnamed protein product, partial [Brassica oleracea]